MYMCAMRSSLALLVLCALITAACGSSSGSSSRAASGTATTKERSAAQTAPAAVAAGELARLKKPTAAAGATLPSASSAVAVDRRYLTTIFDDVQGIWRREFTAAHLAYQPARLVVFSGKVESTCGRHEDSGPFYCPADRTVYLDLRFFGALLRQHGVGSAAEAYIVAHEFGHHVQQLLGISKAVAAANTADPKRENARSVQVELEADCLAGIWASSAYPRSKLTVTDLDNALTTAHVLGDDYIAQATGDVVDSAMWTHGSSQARQQWLTTGFRSGEPKACDTFTGR